MNFPAYHCISLLAAERNAAIEGRRVAESGFAETLAVVNQARDGIEARGMTTLENEGGSFVEILFAAYDAEKASADAAVADNAALKARIERLINVLHRVSADTESLLEMDTIPHKMRNWIAAINSAALAALEADH